MASIGDQFRAAREAKGLSVDQVAGETNIAKRFIAAIEAEDFSVFPGDPYIIGFLRNYAEHLGLDAHAVVQSFRGIRIQEQPVPIQELIKPARPPLWSFIAGAAVLATAALAFLIFGRPARAPAADEPSAARPAPTEYVLAEASFERRLYEGDSVVVNHAGQRHVLAVNEIQDRVAVATPSGVTRFMLGEEGSVDLDGDNRPELFIFIADFQKGQPNKGALTRMRAAEGLNLGAAPADQAPASAETAPSAPASALPERPSTQQLVVFSGKRSPHPFVLNITFRNYAMFRHEIDRGERVEAYYHRGDQITATANNTAKIWSSNAAAVKLTIQASGGQSVDLDLGSPGEVVVKALRWSQGEDGSWSLSLFDVQ